MAGIMEVPGSLAWFLSLWIVRHVPAGEGKEKMASVTFDNATRLYPGGVRPAVDKINLEIADG